jgi:tripartite-type tricarboxylate transporter receptor subunit TctC
MQRRSLVTGIAAAAVVRSARAQQDWPNRPVRLIIPFPPGGGTDIAGRLVGAKLAEILGQPVVIDNRGGAGGMIGTRATGQAPSDGYTLLFNGTLSVLRDGYDPRKEVQHLVRVAVTHNLLVVNETVPSRTVQAFIDYAKSRPGQLNHGTAGPLTSQHLAAVMFDLYAGTRIENVHYRGTGPSIAGLLGNEVQLMFGSMSAVLPLIQDGKARALATSSGMRSALMPELPRIGDVVPDYAAELTYSICAPIGTPAAVGMRLDAAVRAALADEGFVGGLRTRGFEPAYMPTAPLAQAIDADVAKWADVVQRAGISLD